MMSSTDTGCDCSRLPVSSATCGRRAGSWACTPRPSTGGVARSWSGAWRRCGPGNGGVRGCRTTCRLTSSTPDLGLRPRPPGAWAAQDLRRARTGTMGWHRRVPERGLSVPSPPRALDPEGSPRPGGRLPGTTGAGTSASARAAPGCPATRGDGPARLLLRRQAHRDQGSGLAAHGDRRAFGVLLGRAGAR